MAVGGAKPSVVSDKLQSSHGVEPHPSMAGGTLKAIETPEVLSEGGRGIWQLIVPPLLDAGILREDDLVLLVECAEAWAASETFRKRMWQAIKLEEELEEKCFSGELHGDDLAVALAQLEGQDQRVKRARAGWLQALRAAQSLSADLGLGPVARVRLGLAKVQGASLLEILRQMPGGSAADAG